LRARKKNIEGSDQSNHIEEIDQSKRSEKNYHNAESEKRHHTRWTRLDKAVRLEEVAVGSRIARGLELKQWAVPGLALQ
jgi:hypothetical protein